VSFGSVYLYAKFGEFLAIGRSVFFVIACLKLLKDIEYVENNWIKEKG
jgi:hypothetical protein